MRNNKAATIHNPFNTFTNFVYPKTMQDVFVWAQWFWNRNHKYRTSIQKVVTYFVAGIDVTAQKSAQDIDPDQIDFFKQLLTDTYDILPLTVHAGQQLAAMGNLFISAQRAFTRDLCCPRSNCGFSANIQKMTKDQDYTWQAGAFKGKCPRCGRNIQFRVQDTATTLADGRRVRFITRAAQDMRLKYNQLTGQYTYIYKIPDHIKQGIIKGDPIYLNSTPMTYIKAALNGDYIQFDRNKFFSMRTQTLAQLDKLYRGWGVPLFMASFGNLLRLAMLDRFNQAVVMEYIAPVRMLSPAPQLLQAGADPNRNPISGDFFRSVMTKAVKSATANPTTWVVTPFPVQYQMVGGQAKQMAPVDLMQWYVSQILSDMGIPMEFRQTSFQVSSVSMGLRVFERMWIHFAKNLNKFVKWASDIIADAHRIQHLDVQLNMTSFVQDDNNKHIKLQLVQAGILSKTAGLEPFGIDYKQDINKQKQQQAQQMETDQQMQVNMQGAQMLSSVLPPAGSVGIAAAQQNIEAMAAAAQGGAAPAGPSGPMPPAPGGAPAGGGGMPFSQGNSESATLQQLYQQAQAEAQRITQVGQQFGQTARRQQLNKLRSGDKILHAQVMAILQAMDRQVASQAVAQSKGPQQ